MDDLRRMPAKSASGLSRQILCEAALWPEIRMAATVPQQRRFTRYAIRMVQMIHALG
jgi:hypothetical protein